MRTAILMLTGMAAAILSCSAPPPLGTSQPPVTVAAVSISPPSLSVQVGKSAQLSVTVTDSAGNVLARRTATWSSSDTAIAKVNASGMVLGSRVGAASIHVSVEGKSANAAVAVVTVPVSQVSVAPATPSVQVGATVQFTATTRDAASNVLTGRTVTWTSSDVSVATITSAGLAQGKAAGTATIVATSEGVSGQTSLTVTAAPPPPPPPPPPAPVATVAVSLGSATLNVGQTTQASVVLKDANGAVLTGRTVAWSSSNTNVATVNTTGLVTAVAAGTANVTAISEGKTGSATLTVNGTSAGQTLFTDNFESGALGDPGRWHDIVGSGQSIATASTEGITAISGTKVLRLGVSGGALTHFVSTAATSPYERLYLSFYLYRTPAYQSANPGLRAGGIRGSTTQWGSFGVGYNTPGSCPDDPNNVTHQEFMFAYVFQDPAAWALRTYTNWLGQAKLSTNPPTCGGGYALSAGNNPQATYLDINFAPTVSAWHRFEIEVQLNTVGQANGWQRIWVDGVLKVEHLNVTYRTTSGMKLWAVTFDNGTIHGGTLYVDDVVVGTQRP